jgi:hypothetical protein
MPSAFVFHAEHDPTLPVTHSWTIIHAGKWHVSRTLYPTVPGIHGNAWVRAILEAAESDPTGDYSRVDFFFLADIPCNVPGKHAII